MEISTRNILKSKVKSVKLGAVNAEVVVELSSGAEIASIITKELVDRLGLAPSKEAYAI